MFTLVNALMFKPLSGQAGDLVGLFSRDRTKPDTYRAFSYPNFADIREQTGDIFDGLMAHTFAMVGVPAGDTTRRSFVAVVSSNYFDTLGVPSLPVDRSTLTKNGPGRGPGGRGRLRPLARCRFRPVVSSAARSASTR